MLRIGGVCIPTDTPCGVANPSTLPPVLRGVPMRAEADGWFMLDGVTGRIAGFSSDVDYREMVVRNLVVNGVDHLVAPVPVAAIVNAFIRSVDLGFECFAADVRVRFEKQHAHASITVSTP